MFTLIVYYLSLSWEHTAWKSFIPQNKACLMQSFSKIFLTSAQGLQTNNFEFLLFMNLKSCGGPTGKILSETFEC